MSEIMGDTSISLDAVGEGGHEEVFLPMAPESTSEFWTQVARGDTDDGLAPAWVSWAFGVDRRGDFADLFVLGRVTTRVSKRTTRTFTAAIPVVRCNDGAISDEDARWMITRRVRNAEWGKPMLHAAMTSVVEFNRDRPFVRTRTCPIEKLARLHVSPPIAAALGRGQLCDHSAAGWVEREEIEAITLRCPTCGTDHLAVVAREGDDASLPSLDSIRRATLGSAVSGDLADAR